VLKAQEFVQNSEKQEAAPKISAQPRPDFKEYLNVGRPVS
jgi:hypothetical protein